MHQLHPNLVLKFNFDVKDSNKYSTRNHVHYKKKKQIIVKISICSYSSLSESKTSSQEV